MVMVTVKNIMTLQKELVQVKADVNVLNESP